MQVLADLHHFDLYYSFQLLFEKRLGWELYRPIGMDWKNKGYWTLHSSSLIQDGYLGYDTQKQFSKYTEFTDPVWSRHALELLKIGEIVPLADGIFKVYDKSKDKYQKAITLEVFKNTEFDIIISSVPWHFPLYEKLRQKYQPQAKHIFQAGNNWEPPSGCKNMMFSSPPINIPDNINKIEYHQEFDLSTFNFKPTTKTQRISTYAHFPESKALMEQVAKYLPNYYFESIGNHLGPTGEMIIKTQELANHIKDNAFTWHIKPRGEGYGHILHNSFAVGTPVVTNIVDYKGFCGEKLLIDGITCIDVCDKSPKEIAHEIIRMRKDPTIRQNVYSQFRSVVDFDKEFKTIKLFLENLQ